ncbi:uncharacterized protein TRIADDRAFT_58371 [Trichoplax adhaerens]|uniref:Methyltransferase type 11 domain-containing protein n=1 Tax=Trichoplax adhaerens TaxID=10228 RepID=B3S1X4_TRIAD|nr:hypothetical protein TRIADDRAFT_58371 [Trichoplax adhaerens]EDV23582.1 hypothetical protein TRIADDRAFT_58371 [Trichoplax adhaerens]|eukprot:XP_002114492.1 hypothetical protein TRIADDRAFT_58371 [Trichoplax adhaerens]
MASPIFHSIELRRVGSEDENSHPFYYTVYQWKMAAAPPDLVRFCDPTYDQQRKKELTHWIRNPDDKTSCQTLQILFAFSVPTLEAINTLRSLRRKIVSAGAGCGYWEFLLASRGVEIIAFDANGVYPKEMHYITIQTGSSELLSQYSDYALMLAWPDDTDESSFSVDCLSHYEGDCIIHIGELFGETLSFNPWGQSTSCKFQLELLKSFRCIKRVNLPNWPGHKDNLTIWRRINSNIRFPTETHCYFEL